MPNGHFLSTSVRVAQSLAYHDEEACEEDSTRDVEQEGRVFWIAFVNHTNESMLSNTPTTHRREDIITAKPELNPDDNLGAVAAAGGQWKTNIFALRVNLALIQAEAIEQVLCIRAKNTAPLDVQAAAVLVFARLQAFRENEIFKLSPARLYELLYRSDIVHTVCLEVNYFSTVFRLHAFLAFDRNPRFNPFTIQGLSQISAVKEQKCVAEAKRLLSLLAVAPRGDAGLYWMHHIVVVAAFVTLAAHLLNNLDDFQPMPDDLRCLSEVVVDLGILSKRCENVSIGQQHELCADMLSRLHSSLRIRSMAALQV